MAFLAPFFASVLGLGAVGTALLEIGAAVGLGFAARKLAGQGATAETSIKGRTLSLNIATDRPRVAVFGKVGITGDLEYWQLYGPDNSHLQMVISLADHECEQIDGVWVNGTYRLIDGDGYVNSYGTSLRVNFHSGSPTQVAPNNVVTNSSGRWTSNDRGLNVCYVVVTIEYDEKKFPDIPEFLFVIRGCNQLYNPATGLTGYSNNPAVILYNVLRGLAPNGVPLIGMNVPADAIRTSDVVAAIAACDEAIPLLGGGTEDRYRCNGVYSTDQDNRAIIESILATMAGDCIEAGGIYRIMAGVSRTPVAHITDADLIVTKPFASDPKGPRSALTNAVAGAYSNPARRYNMTPLPARTSSVDEALDGGIRLARDLQLEAVTSRTQGQRLMEIARKRARRQLAVTGTFRAALCVLEPGDWVTFSSDRRGYSSRVFEVAAVRQNPDCTVDLDLAEVDDGLDDWSTSDQIADNEVEDLLSAGPSLAAVSSFALAAVSISSGGAAERPALTATWTAITDPTVIEVEIEYRRTGDTAALSVRAINPSSGTYTWVTGVQGGTTYEARARPVTRPERAVDWTAWTAMTGSTGNQVVAVAAYALDVPPEALEGIALSDQEAFELALVTAIDASVGSLPGEVAALKAEIETLSRASIDSVLTGTKNRTAIQVERSERLSQDAALAQQITTVAAELETGIGAQVQQFMTAQAAENAATAQLIGTVSTRVDNNEATVAIIQTSIDGISGQIGLVLNIDGHVTGLVSLDGTANYSTLTIVADALRIARNDVAGGDPIPVFTLQSVNGNTQLALVGDFIADGAITARHLQVATLSALSADLGNITAGLIRNDANSIRFDVANMVIYRTDGKMTLDFANLIFEMTT